MKNRKLIIILSIIFLLLVICTVVIFFCTNHNIDSDKNELTKNENGMYNVPVSSWDNDGSRYVICEIENNNISTNYSDSYTKFQSKLTLDELAKQNKDFIEKTKLYYDHLEYDANLYFSDNNYYMIFYTPKNEDYDAFYTAISLSSMISSNEKLSRTVFPLPMNILLSEVVIKSYKEERDIVYLDYFFDRFTFEDACEFYERYTNGVAEIDYGNKLIYVDAREMNHKNTYHEKYLCIDFVNRRFICDKDGENEVVFE